MAAKNNTSPDLLTPHFPFKGKLVLASVRGKNAYVTDAQAPHTRECDFYYSSYPYNYNNDTLMINFTGEELCKKGYYVKRFQCDMFFVKLILEGSMQIYTRGTEYLLHPGDLFFVHRNNDIEYTVGPEGYCRKVGATICGYLLDAMLLSASLSEMDYIHLAEPRRVEKQIRQGMNILKERGRDFLRHSAVTAFDLLLMLGEERQRGSYPLELSRALAFSQQRPHCAVSASELAAAAGCRQVRLNELFRRYFGITPVAYHTRQRLREAEALLLNTDASIKEIADRVGYSSAIYFSNDFKKHLSVSPRHFRQNA